MKILLNGEPYQSTSPLTVAGLLESVGYAGQRLAVVLNDEIVPRGRYTEINVSEGDKLDLVMAVGGG